MGDSRETVFVFYAIIGRAGPNKGQEERPNLSTPRENDSPKPRRSTEWEIEGGMFPGAGVDLYLRKIGKETDDVKHHGRSLKVTIPYFEAT